MLTKINSLTPVFIGDAVIASINMTEIDKNNVKFFKYL